MHHCFYLAYVNGTVQIDVIVTVLEWGEYSRYKALYYEAYECMNNT